MNCPSCGAQVDEGQAICPQCDFIIDASFLSSEPPERDDEDTPAAPPPQRPAPARPPRPTRAAGAAPGAGAKRRPPAGAKRKRPPPSNNRTDTPPAGVPAARSEDLSSLRSAGIVPSRATGEFDLSLDAGLEDELGNLKAFFLTLSTPDKLTLAAAVLNFVLACMPWKVTVDDGEVLGLLSMGFPVVLGSLAGLGALVARVRNLLPKSSPMVPWVAQLVAFAFCALWCIVYVVQAWDHRTAQSPIGNYEAYVSTPAFGVFLALLVSGGAVATSAMQLRHEED